MNKELKFSGYTAQPSDYECPDGDLASVLNLIPEKGALRPVPKPTTVLTLASNRRVVYLHETAAFKHFIILQTSVVSGVSKLVLFWMQENEQTIHNFGQNFNLPEVDYVSVSGIGNTLLFLTKQGVRYFLWNSEQQTYSDLQYGLPECPMSFGLKREAVYESAEFHATLPHGVYIANPSHANSIFNFDKFTDYDNESFQRANENAVSESVLAQVNKFINEEGTMKGRFVMPFFVRYALKMYDGSYIHHSAPILMLPSTGIVPQVACMNTWGTERQTDLTLRVRGCTFSLDYAITNSSVKTNLLQYKDLISAVDVFISAPIYKYKQGGVCPGMSQYAETGKSICSFNEKYGGQITYTQYMVESYLYYALQSGWLNTGNYGGDPATCYVKLPRFNDEEIREDVISRAQFYLLKSIPLEDLQTSRTKIEIDDEYLQSLVNRQVMSDGYNDHDRFIPHTSIVYNSRINFTNLELVPFKGFGPEQFAFTNNSDDWGHAPENIKCYVFIREDTKDIIVESDSFPVGLDDKTCGYYFFYPNTKAYKAVWGSSAGGWLEVELKEHPTLNGAYYFGDWSVSGTACSEPTPTTDNTISIPNKIYTSEVNNPFSFPVTNINTIGTGRILGISTAAKALSQGQFGQFPLYAFTTDGVWALEVSSTTGAFSAKQPITRDVCINPDSITQIDSAVLFATDRGIMLISGSQTQCITDVIDNDEEPFIFTNLPLSSQIRSMLFSGGETESSQYPAFPERGFTTVYLRACQMLYAYNRQAIIVFNPNYGYCYVYSMESKNWGIIHQNIKSRLNSYPQAYAMLADGRLVDFSQDDTVPAKQFLLTRPLKLDGSLKDIHKTIDTIIARGKFEKGHVGIVLYGSRDLTNWFPVATSADHYLRGFRGTPYKHFRIALICSLTHDESVWGASVQFTPRLTNQPR